MGLFSWLYGSEPSPKPRASVMMTDEARTVENIVGFFMTASLLRGSERASKHWMLAAAYLLGAVDAVRQHAKLSDSMSIEIFVSICQECLSKNRLQALQVVAMVQCPEHSHLASAVNIGGQAVLDWYSETDKMAPLRLFDLLKTVEE